MKIHKQPPSIYSSSLPACLPGLHTLFLPRFESSVITFSHLLRINKPVLFGHWIYYLFELYFKYLFLHTRLCTLTCVLPGPIPIILTTLLFLFLDPRLSTLFSNCTLVIWYLYPYVPFLTLLKQFSLSTCHIRYDSPLRSESKWNQITSAEATA